MMKNVQSDVAQCVCEKALNVAQYSNAINHLGMMMNWVAANQPSTTLEM